MPFRRLARRVLGARFTLSLAFVSPGVARALNRRYRGKAYAPNILTFPFRAREGEIVICPAVARGQARAEGSDYAEYLERLFIHGLLHLKGYAHGTKMRSAERRLSQAGRLEEEIGSRK